MNDDFKKKQALIDIYKHWDNKEPYVKLLESTLFNIYETVAKLKKENKELSWDGSLNKAEETIKILRDILENEYGACMECIDAKLQGYTICGDCSC